MIFYRTFRNTYQRLLNRDAYRERLRRRAYFQPFVRPGDLVFDIGAHRGHYAETFRELGARVVAVEPNPSLAAEIRRHFPGIAVVGAAVGAKPGTATLNIGRDDQHSTVSREWAAVHPERWQDTITVPMTTLDELILEHGEPGFVKIDVEGFETEVLRGLTVAPPAVSFEFQAALPDPEPFRLLDALGNYEYAVASSPYVRSPHWDDSARASLLVAAVQSGSGDVLARLKN